MRGIPRLHGTPLVSPLLAEELANLPPAAVITAGFDPLLEDGRAYAGKLEAAENRVRYREYPTLAHVFLHMGEISGAAERANGEILDILKSFTDEI